MENVKRNIVSFWLTHVFLRRIAKRYPEYFTEFITELTDDKTARKIMLLRYTGEDPMKFEAIAIKLNIAPRRVFEKHKKVIDHIIGAI